MSENAVSWQQLHQGLAREHERLTKELDERQRQSINLRNEIEEKDAKIKHQAAMVAARDADVTRLAIENKSLRDRLDVQAKQIVALQGQETAFSLSIDRDYVIPVKPGTSSVVVRYPETSKLRSEVDRLNQEVRQRDESIEVLREMLKAAVESKEAIIDLHKKVRNLIA